MTLLREGGLPRLHKIVSCLQFAGDLMSWSVRRSSGAGFGFQASSRLHVRYFLVTESGMRDVPRNEANCMTKSLPVAGGSLRSDSGFDCKESASVGQVVTHNPQPMHRSRSTAATSSSPTLMASIWQRLTQVSQAEQALGSTAAK